MTPSPAGRIPPEALLLGLAGVIPFAWGALTILAPTLGDWSLQALGSRLTGRTLLVLYGTIILSFMAGAAWGLALGAEGRARAVLLALATLPALWALVAGFATVALALGFVALLALDRHLTRTGLAPPWWLRLRLLLTALVVPCLLVALP